MDALLLKHGFFQSDFNGTKSNDVWTVSHYAIPTQFDGVGPTIDRAIKDWLRQYRATNKR